MHICWRRGNHTWRSCHNQAEGLLKLRGSHGVIKKW